MLLVSDGTRQVGREMGNYKDENLNLGLLPQTILYPLIVNRLRYLCFKTFCKKNPTRLTHTHLGQKCQA